MCAKFRESRIGYSRSVHYYCMCMWPCVCACVCVCVGVCTCRNVTALCKFMHCTFICVHVSFVHDTVSPFHYSPVFTDRYWTGLSEQLWLHYLTLLWVDTDHRTGMANAHKQRHPTEIFKRVWRRGIFTFESCESRLFAASQTLPRSQTNKRLSHACVSSLLNNGLLLTQTEKFNITWTEIKSESKWASSLPC